MRACEIASRLAAQVDGVVRELMPKGRKIGQEWRCGGLSGEPGESLGVHLAGDKAGVWADFATGESGDLIGLWMAVKGLTLGDACTEALAYLGIRDDNPQPPAKVWKKPTRDGVSRLSDEHSAWLTGERKLPLESVHAYRLASRGDRLMFPYLDQAGELVFAKYRRLPKQFSADAECEPILFGWQAVPSSARSVVICEGELDAIAWHAYGYPAMSVPTGAGAHGWIEREFDRLARFDEIYLSMDSDDRGQAAIPELCERLGRERTFVVSLPGKDANDCLMTDVPRDAITTSVRRARTMDPSELRRAGEFEDAVWKEFSHQDSGLLLPWAKTHDDIRLRPGELSIWAGVNGHGKSRVVSHIVAQLVSSGTRCCVASMEYRTPLWLMHMHKQASGNGSPPEAFVRAINRKFNETLWAFDVPAKSKASRILEVFAYARRRYAIELFAIDNLTKCGFADDDYSGQKAFTEALSDFARDTQAHVMLVAHMRKGEDENKPAGKMSVKGSGGITDMADTVIEVWRNKPKEKAVAIATHTNQPIPEKYVDAADTMLLTHKQRATGKEPAVKLWFDQGSTQFLAHEDHRARPLVSWSAINGAAA